MIYFLEDENNTEVPNAENKGDNPLIILNNFYILHCLDYSQTIFCLYITSYLTLPEQCI